MHSRIAESIMIHSWILLGMRNLTFFVQIQCFGYVDVTIFMKIEWNEVKCWKQKLNMQIKFNYIIRNVNMKIRKTKGEILPFEIDSHFGMNNVDASVKGLIWFKSSQIQLHSRMNANELLIEMVYEFMRTGSISIKISANAYFLI